MSEGYLLLKKCESELEKAFTERDILLEHSASLEVQIRTMIEEQAIREFHNSQQATVLQHHDTSTNRKESLYPPLPQPKDAILDLTAAEDKNVDDGTNSTMNGTKKNTAAPIRSSEVDFIDHGVVDEQEILLLRDKLHETEKDMLRLRNELAVSKDTVKSMIEDSANRDREDMMRIYALNQELRVPVFYNVSRCYIFTCLFLNYTAVLSCLL